MTDVELCEKPGRVVLAIVGQQSRLISARLDKEDDRVDRQQEIKRDRQPRPAAPMRRAQRDARWSP